MANFFVKIINFIYNRFTSIIYIFLISIGCIGFFKLTEYPWYIRYLMLLPVIIIGLLNIYIYFPIKKLIIFFNESYKELCKVVWPSIKETKQTTLVVYVFVLVTAIFLWIIDKLIEWIIFSVVLGWR